jgi:hypothetical protein
MPDDKKTGLQTLLGEISGVGETKASWPATLFLIGFLVLLVSLLGIKLALTKRKAADLAKDLREKNEEIARAKEAEKLTKNEEERTRAHIVLIDSESKVNQIKLDMEKYRVDHEACMYELSSISNWDDIIVVDDRKG